MQRSSLLLLIGMCLGVVATTIIDTRIVDAQAIQSWTRDQVVAFLFVKPDIGGFVPKQGNSIGISWNKGEIVPICLVKPSIGGFVPIEGSAIGTTWSKNEVEAVVVVEPHLGMFTASTSTLVTPPVSAPSRPPASGSSRSCNLAIETHIDGDFNGWEGETLYKMDDGTIWKQSTYRYHYQYSYHPSVIIFSNESGGCHIKVAGDDDEGTDVMRIK